MVSSRIGGEVNFHGKICIAANLLELLLYSEPHAVQ